MIGLSAATLATAFLGGLLSVLSPCVLPLLPAYVTLISGVSIGEIEGVAPDRSVRRRVLVSSLGFVIGFSAVFVVLGASATAFGHVFRSWHTEVLGAEIGVAQIAGLVIVLMGLHVARVIQIPALYRDRRFQAHRPSNAFLGTCLAGAAFAFGWSPCVGPILAAILTLAAGQETVRQGVALLSIYSAGLAIPFLLAGWSTQFLLRALKRVKRYYAPIQLASGVFLVSFGLLVFTGQLTRLNGYLAFLGRFGPWIEGSLL